MVGETVVGLTLTLLLRRAGYDPLLVGGTGSPVPSRLTYLCAPALRVLDAVGAGTRLRERSVTVDSVSVRQVAPPEESRAVLARDGPPEETRPVVVRTRWLRRVLEERLPEEQRRAERAVDTFSRRDSGLVVEFGDGIREWFDVVVDAGGGGTSLRPAGRDPPKHDALAQYDTLVESDALPRNQVRDFWYPDAFVQLSPRPNDPGGMLRVTAPRSAIATALESETVGNSIGEGVVVDALGGIAPERVETESTTVRQVRLSDGVGRREWWGDGRVAFCGPAACPLAPGSGYGAWFGIEDAVAFVLELNGRGRPASDLVDAYASGRNRRLAALRRTAEAARPDHEYPLPRSAHPALASLGVFRHVALGEFLGERLRAVRGEAFR